jgi:diketogulonate reductase-like aldo/keto reductase
VSNFTTAHLKQLLDVSDNVPAVNQIEFHPFIYDEQKDLIDFCGQQGIAVEAYSPLAQGNRSHEVLTLIGKHHGKSAAQVMLRWAIQKGTIPLPRSANPKHIRENFEVLDFELSDKEIEHIDDLSSGERQSWNPTDLP